MPVNLNAGNFRRAPAGYYLCKFIGIELRDGLNPKGETIEKCVYRFVGTPYPANTSVNDDSYDLSIWVTNTFGAQSHQRKLLARMAGTSKRDSMGALEAVPAELDPNDPRLQELASTNFADWEGQEFILRQLEGENRAGERTTWCDVENIWRPEGAPALLPPLGEKTKLETHPSGRPVSQVVIGAVEAQAPPAPEEDPFRGEE